MGDDGNNLMERFVRGDEEAFRLLVGECAPVLRARARRRMPKKVLRRVSLADIVQEAQIVAFQRCAQFRPGGPASFRNWMLGIVDRKAMEAIERHMEVQKRAVAREVTRGQRPDTAHHVGRQPSPSEHAIAAETAERVQRALATLPPHYQRVLRLAREDGLSLGEVAERTGRSREAVKKVYGRALCKFKEAFEEEQP